MPGPPRNGAPATPKRIFGNAQKNLWHVRKLRQTDPGLVGPADGAALAPDDSVDAVLLQLPEAFIGRLQIQERQQIASPVQ